MAPLAVVRFGPRHEIVGQVSVAVQAVVWPKSVAVRFFPFAFVDNEDASAAAIFVESDNLPTDFGQRSHRD